MALSRRSFLKTAATAAVTTAIATRGASVLGAQVAGQQARPRFFPLLPAPATFPDFPNRQAAIAEAKRKSDALEAYISQYLDGKVSARIPTELLLPGDDPKIVPRLFPSSS
jgi:hypothetical protein